MENSIKKISAEIHKNKAAIDKNLTNKLKKQEIRNAENKEAANKVRKLWREKMIAKCQNSFLIQEMWNKDEIQRIPRLTTKALQEISKEIDEFNNDK